MSKQLVLKSASSTTFSDYYTTDGNYIYYVDINHNQNTYRCDLDENNKTEMVDNQCCFVWAYENCNLVFTLIYDENIKIVGYYV